VEVFKFANHLAKKIDFSDKLLGAAVFNGKKPKTSAAKI
jgi:hypothetical protein